MNNVYTKYAKDYLYQLPASLIQKIAYSLFIPISKENIPILNDLKMRVVFYPKKKKDQTFDTLFDIFDYVPDNSYHGFLSVLIDRRVVYHTDNPKTSCCFETVTEEHNFRFREGDYIGIVFPPDGSGPKYGIMSKETLKQHWVRCSTKEHFDRFYKRLM